MTRFHPIFLHCQIELPPWTAEKFSFGTQVCIIAATNPPSQPCSPSPSLPQRRQQPPTTHRLDPNYLHHRKHRLSQHLRTATSARGSPSFLHHGTQHGGRLFLLAIAPHAHPYPPTRATANLVSVKVLVSLIGQVGICGGFQMWAFYYVRSQPWYTPPVIDPNEELNTSNPENTAVFLISSFQYSVGCLVYTTGYPYRKNPITNVWLMASVTLLFLFSLYALFTPGGFVADLLGLVPFPRSFHIALFVAVVLNTILSFVFESLLSPYVVKLVKGVQRFARRSRRNRGRKHGSKTYKAVERSMQNDGEV